MLYRRLCLLGSALLLASSQALAQAEPEGLTQAAPASVGSTDVAAEGFQTVEKPADSTDATHLFLSAGGLWASGNSRALSLTGSGNFRLRRDVHQLTAVTAANLGRSAPSRSEPMETTVENYQGRARYDLFFADHLAGFLQLSARRDRFQGLKLRLNIDPGLAYYIIDAKTQQFWGEIGYDLQHDVRRDDALLVEETGVRLNKTETRHHGRAFVGYDNRVNEAVTFTTGLEYLQGLSPLEDENSGQVNWRLNWDAGLTSKIGKSFAIATTFSVKYDNNPLPGLARTDTVTAMNLVYDLF